MTEKKNSQILAAVWIPIGVALGAGFGVALDNMVAGLLIGLVFGSALAVGFWANARRRKRV